MTCLLVTYKHTIILTLRNYKTEIQNKNIVNKFLAIYGFRIKKVHQQNYLSANRINVDNHPQRMGSAQFLEWKLGRVGKA